MTTEEKRGSFAIPEDVAKLQESARNYIQDEWANSPGPGRDITAVMTHVPRLSFFRLKTYCWNILHFNMTSYQW